MPATATKMILSLAASSLLLLLLGGSSALAEVSDRNEAGHECCPGSNTLDQGACYTTSDRRNASAAFRLRCARGMYVLDPEDIPEDGFRVNDDGDLVLPNISDSIPVESGKYCVINKRPGVKMAFACFPVQEDQHYALYGALGITSIVFLCLTLAVYALVPQLRDLQGLCIMCLCVSLALGYAHLAPTQIGVGRMGGLCVFTAFGIYFWMLSAFFWMNVVAINVMRCTMFKNTTLSDMTIFVYYNIYGWGMPFLFLLMAIIAHNVEGDHIKPGFGDRGCWFTASIATWTYFYGPIAIILCVNIVLYTMTSLVLWQKSSYNNVTKIASLRYKFLLYAKLFVVVGLSWIFELISFVHNDRRLVWFVMDVFNALQGLVFFLLLVVFRRRALVGLARALPLPCLARVDARLDDECDEIIGGGESRAADEEFAGAATQVLRPAN